MKRVSFFDIIMKTKPQRIAKAEELAKEIPNSFIPGQFINPVIESSHAVAYGMKLAKTMGKGSVLINLSGRGDKDMDYIIEKYGIR